MTLDLSFTGFVGPGLRVAKMDISPPSASQADKTERNRLRAQFRAHFLKLMKQKFPGLPY